MLQHAPANTDTKPTRLTSVMRTIGIVAAISVAVILAAMSIQLGPKVVLIFAALIVSPAILFASLRSVVYGLIVLSFVVSGSLFFFAGMSFANWVPYLLCAALSIRVVTMRAATNGFRGHDKLEGGTPPFFSVLFAFFLLVVIASFLNKTSVGFAILAFKNFFVMWIPAFLLSKESTFEQQWRGVWKLLLGIAILQLPVAVVQRIHQFGGRAASGLNWDSIVGTFGGDPDGGGLSGAMGLFLVFATLLAGSMWRNRQLTGNMFTLVAVSAFIVIGLAEVKAALLLFPIAFLFLFRDMIKKRPLLFVLGSFMAVAVFMIMLFAYYRMYVGKEGIDHGFVDTLVPKFANFFDPNFADRHTGEVGRIPALFFWWAGNSSDMFSVAFGHGPMAVRISSVFGAGSIIAASPFNVGMYSLPVFLWELGTMATASFLLSLALATVTALRLSKNNAVPPDHRAALSAGSFAIFMVALFMPYNRDLIDSSAIQLLLALLFAHTAYWWARMRPARTPLIRQPFKP